MAPTRAGIAHQPRGQTTIEYLTLEAVSVKAWVVDVSSRIVLSQTFYNSSNEPTGKAKYVFPLPASAAVCAFELELPNGTIIVGEVKEREEATLTFTNAVNQGKTAALVERVTDDIFTISVGSIPATTRVTAHLIFVMDLLDEGSRDHVRLQLPMYIAERYGTPPAAMENASSAHSHTQVRVDISVDIQTSGVIHAILSPTHSIRLQRYKGHSGRKSQRRMSAVWKSSEFLTCDFVIAIHAEGLDKPRCFAEVLSPSGDLSSNGSTIAMQMTLVPGFLTPKVSSQEYIFIIDRSGSMSGSAIETAKRTLTMLLRLLPSEQTTFNIFSFGTGVTSLWKSSRGLDRASLDQATLHVASMNADYGGTEIPGALRAAFNSRGLDRPSVVFLLTDGLVQGTRNHGTQDPFLVISNAVGNSPPQAPVRLFVLGIGNQVSSDVCSSLAAAGNGECLFALAVEDISGKCARLLNAGRSKNIESIVIDWGQSDASPLLAGAPSPVMPTLPATLPTLAPPPPVQQAPHALQKIFSGIRFTVFAIMTSGTVPTSVKLTIKLHGVDNHLEQVVDVVKVKPFPASGRSSVPMVHTLAARKLIMELDRGSGLLPAPAAGDALLASEDDLRKAGIVRLGLAYQLVSKYTSFVAVQQGNERTRNRRHKSGGSAWVRSRLQRTDRSTPEDNPAVAPTFLDDLISGVVSIFASVFGFLGGPTSTTNNSHSRLQQQKNIPGTYDGSNSDKSETSRGRGSSPRSPRGGSPASHHTTDSFSTLSSLEGSSCSSCWTPSRTPSPLPVPSDPIDRAPSPKFIQDPPVINPSAPTGRVGVSQDVYRLHLEMDLDGSFTASTLLTQLVGEAVLSKAEERGIDEKVWATAVAAAYMQIHLQSEPDLLELITEKAKEFVLASGHAKKDFDEMVRAATALLNK